MKITERITGYNEMSAEDKLKALEALEEDNDYVKLKSSLSKANSEAANYKKQLQEKMTEQEKIEAERIEKDKAIQDELTALRKEKQISSFKANYLSLGYENENADAAAKAQADGDFNALFQVQKKHEELVKAKFEQEKLNGQPGVSGTNGSNGKLPDYDKMSDAEYYASKFKK